MSAELRYNINGTVRRETQQEAAERNRPRGRGQPWSRPPKPAISREEAIAAARSFVAVRPTASSAQASESDDFHENYPAGSGEGPPSWGYEADRVLFGRGGEASFRRGGQEFDDFKGFFEKYKAMREKKRKTETEQIAKIDNEVEVARHALVLFQDFQEKKRKELAQKIEKERSSLPIKPFEAKIVEAVRNNPVVLIAADTGAGKSTQVPQYLLAAGFDKICCTQPRRIACYSLARRVSYESLNIYGSEIAYQVRFEGTKTAKTKILFLTEGVLLRQFAGDPRLANYNVIIVDEVHERHITGDFLLGVLKRLLTYRNDIRIVLMSATINTELFSKYFNAPIVEIPGRMYPVTIEYHPIDKEDRNLVDDQLYRERLRAEVRQSVPATPAKLNAAPYLRIIEKIDQTVPAEERGDMLVFLSGINEISLLAEELRAYASYTKKWIILLLHSSLSVTDQEKVFDVAPPGVRKCILSTNIAETSVTIDGVRFIVDSGKVKEMGYDPAANLSRLSEFWISQSSAKQRAGRAGRTGPGECYRFYSQREYSRLNAFPVPEILRMPLEPTLLQIRAYGLGDPREFEFIERPSEANINHSIRRLQDLGALDRGVEVDGAGAGEEISTLGRVLAVLPLDVVLGKMLVLGSIFDLVDSIIIIAAALSVQSPFIRVPESKLDIMENRRALQSDHGDPFTLLNIFSEWLRVKAERRESSRNWCKRHGIEEQRLYEMVKLKKQFEGVLADYLDVGPEIEESDTEDSEDRFGRKRRRRGNRDGRKEDYKDPEYRRRREQRQLLERQKRLQSSGKRKVLRLEEEDVEGEMNDDARPEDITDISIDALEFALKNDAASLLRRSDAGNLTERDVGLLKLIVCSGLYPHLAVADEANHTRTGLEQMFHTKGKRFVQMHPTSVFFYKPELVQPTVQKVAPQIPSDAKPTLATLHAKAPLTELLCYVELLETTKPYLTNVTRLPAFAACLLFGRSSADTWLEVDVTPDLMHLIVDEWLVLRFGDPRMAEKVLVLAIWLRLAWEIVVSGKLQNAQRGLQTVEIPSAGSTPPSIGTAISGTDSGVKPSGPRQPQQLRYNLSRPSEWSDIAFIPPAVRRIRRDWEDAVARGGAGEFEDVAAEDVSSRLVEFLDLDVICVVERLKMQDVTNMFGYEAYIPENIQKASMYATPHLRYFVPSPSLITRKVRDRVKLPSMTASGTSFVGKVDESTSAPRIMMMGTPAVDVPTPKSSQPKVVDNEETDSGRKRFECGKCGKVLLLKPVEALRHRKACS
ncbi:DEAH (Asp-Glu-Ala-His) box polypeptide 34 [Borealophlyctis nickersoniae]|nr:DEAH (Asp-Glu-Ala-His) box polypeptide 34 [Borealophlyctis nickersoniae]